MWPFTRSTTRNDDAERAAGLVAAAAEQLDAEIEKAPERLGLAERVRGQRRHNGFSEAMERLYYGAS